jgi:HD-GYP domain-containing protein (c-di-GMP phosphodiesterase class II)
MASEQPANRGDARQSFYARQQLIDTARTAFQQLAAVLRNSTLYPEAHPYLLTAADKLGTTLGRLLVDRKQAPFYLVGGELFFETISIPIDQSLALVMEQLTGKDIGGIIFLPGLKPQELTRLASLLHKDAAFYAKRTIHDVIAQEGVEHIQLHRVLLVDDKVGSVIKEGKQKAAELFKDAADTVKELVRAEGKERSSALRKMNTIVQTMVDNIMENREALLSLTNLKMYDEYTFAHSVNTSILAVSLGNYLSLEKTQIASLGVAGLMHDIGKMNVPHEIINKPGKLTEAEWEQVKRHPIEGALLLSDIPGMSKLAMVAAFEHHQHGGERGYPAVGDGHAQHPFSQIVSLADAYEALTAARVYYKTQMPPDNAVRILLKKGGTAFNPVLVKAFVNMIGLFPIGTLLKLDTGEVGLVMHQTRDLLRPRVLLLTCFDGSEKSYGQEVSLVETEHGHYRRTVVGTIDPNIAKINVKQYIV